jgi:hypothetical protein
VRPALVNGAAGVIVAPRGQPFSVMGFTVVGGKIVAIDAIADPERLASWIWPCSTTDAPAGGRRAPQGVAAAEASTARCTHAGSSASARGST